MFVIRFIYVHCVQYINVRKLILFFYIFFACQPYIQVTDICVSAQIELANCRTNYCPRRVDNYFGGGWPLEKMTPFIFLYFSLKTKIEIRQGQYFLS